MSGGATARDAGSDVIAVRESRESDGRWHLETWERRWPGAVVGITGSGEDFGLGGGDDAWRVTERYQALASASGCRLAAVGRQVHGRRVRAVEGPGRGGVLVTGEYDGHVSRSPGVLLAVTAADCVPVYLAAPRLPAWGLVHAGWRGLAAGVLEEALTLMDDRYGVEADALHLHLGPAICGECYEVGPEVVDALGPLVVTTGREREGRPRVDLRATLARRAAAAGVPPERMSRSAWCTCCTGDQFRSYRCSDAAPGRMAAFLGWRAAEPSDEEGPG